MQESTFKELEAMFLALGDKTRLRLLALMADAPVAVGFLADRLNESQPKVSRHLAYLRNAGLVNTTRDGKWIYYGIRYPHDAVRRRLLETLISSIAVMRVGGKDAYLEETYTAELDQTDIYIETYIMPKERAPMPVEYYEPEAQDADEMDVFLL